jgi:aminopeptidase N
VKPSTVAPTHPDPDDALRRIHDACLERLATSEPGDVLQLAAAHGVIASATDSSLLHAWLDGDLPSGLVLDSDLRWRVLVAIASRGGVDRAALDSALAESPSTAAAVAHARAVASLPAPDAKAWAWDRWTGAADASAYELQACGQGFWQPHQTELTRPWVERYLAEAPDAPRVHQGWVLADAVAWFFPITALDRAVVSDVHALAERDDLEPVVARTLRTCVAALESRVRARQGGDR